MAAYTFLISFVVAAALLASFKCAAGPSGLATFYTDYSEIACSTTLPSNGLFAAGSQAIYDNGAACGKHYHISCRGSGCKGSGSITVKLVDYCPGCASNQFDLSVTAFSKLADLSVGEIHIKYHRV